MMGAPKLQRGEIEIETWLQFFAVPCVGPQELLVIFAFLIPVCQERAGKVEAFSIPALRHHVYLPTNLLLVDLFRFLRVRDIEHSTLAIAETIDEQRFVIGAKADVHWQHTAFDVTDCRNLLCLPFAAVVLINQPEFGCQRGRSEGVIVFVSSCPTTLQRPTWYLAHFFGLTREESPHNHGSPKMFQRLS